MMLKTFKTRLVHIWKVIQLSVADFTEVRVTKMSAALAYYTIFALAPILIIIIRISSFFAAEKPRDEIFVTIRSFVGNSAAEQIQSMLENAMKSQSSGIAYMISIIALVFSSTGVFTEIQDSINTIWRLRAKPKKGFLKLLINRLLSFSIVISLGFILLVSLIISTVLDGISHELTRIFPASSIFTATIINIGITFLTIVSLFTIIFKVLPDTRIRWRDVFTGSVVTGLLFMVGKFAISYYISNSRISSTYGAAGSIIVILTWVYYSAIILYLGAVITRANAHLKGRRIAPNDYAVWIEQVVEIDKNNTSERIDIG